jgi:FkbM family methyltransferase
MKILNQKLFQFGLIFAPLFYPRTSGKGTCIQVLNPTTKLKMRVNTYDKVAVYEVWDQKEYETEDFIIGPDDVVIDIGAHIGAFSVWAARQATSGQVYAFEPNNENHSLLEENKTLNGLTNLQTFNLAVSDHDGEATLFNSGHSSVSHSFFETDAQNKTTVRTISLADILRVNQIDKVNYLKIDAEGAEYLIILSTPPIVLRQIDKIFIEYHDYLDHGYNYRELETYLINNGFQVETGRNIFHRYILKQGYIKARRTESK